MEKSVTSGESDFDDETLETEPIPTLVDHWDGAVSAKLDHRNLALDFAGVSGIAPAEAAFSSVRDPRDLRRGTWYRK